MKMDKSVQITGIIVIGFLILGLIVFLAFKSMNPSMSNTISVSGQSTLEVMPDLVGVYFSVDTKGTTSAEATSANAEIVDTLKTSLIAKGFKEEDIKTQGFNVYPEYDYRTSTAKITGYRATHSIKVELSATDSSKIGEVIDAGISAGAGISYINFELTQENQNKYKAESMKLAAQDATSKASGVAEGLGKELGNLVSVSVDNYGYMPWLAYDSAGASVPEIKQATTDITPSEQQISSSVTAVFKIR